MTQKNMKWIKGDFDQEVHAAMSVRNSFANRADHNSTEHIIDEEEAEWITVSQYKQSKKGVTKAEARMANFVANAGSDKPPLVKVKPANLRKPVCDPTWCPCGPPPELTNRSDGSALDQGPATVAAGDGVLDEGPVNGNAESSSEYTNHKPHSALGTTSVRVGAKATADGDLQKAMDGHAMPSAVLSSVQQASNNQPTTQQPPHNNPQEETDPFGSKRVGFVWGSSSSLSTSVSITSALRLFQTSSSSASMPSGDFGRLLISADSHGTADPRVLPEVV